MNTRKIKFIFFVFNDLKIVSKQVDHSSIKTPNCQGNQNCSKNSTETKTKVAALFYYIYYLAELYKSLSIKEHRTKIREIKTYISS